MIDMIIAQECVRLYEALRRAAGLADSATALRQIAQAMENIDRGAAIYRDGLVSAVQRNDNGLIITAIVAGDEGTASVATGIKSEDIRWSCSCVATSAAFNGVCSHIVAVKLAIAVEGAADRQQERAERRKLIPRLSWDLGARAAQLKQAQAAEREAQRIYDEARTAYEDLIDQINVDDAEARAELAWSEHGAPAASRQEAA